MATPALAIGRAYAEGDTWRAMSQENVEVVRLAYAAISEGDFDALADLMDPDCVLDFSRSIGPQRGVYRGHGEFVRFAAATEEAFERFELTPIEFAVGAGGRIVVRHRLSAKGRGSEVELDRCRMRQSSGNSPTARSPRARSTSTQARPSKAPASRSRRCRRRTSRS
jgi:ketosteroid isomerase-like protein